MFKIKYFELTKQCKRLDIYNSLKFLPPVVNIFIIKMGF